ncbi:MAG: TVP38/TMEM64 family protein [Pseudomonadota bacterium]
MHIVTLTNAPACYRNGIPASRHWVEISISDQHQDIDRVRKSRHKTVKFAWRALTGFVVVLALLLGGFAAIWLLKDGTVGLSGDTIAAYVKSWGVWGQLSVIGLMIAHSFIPFPAEFVAIAAGMSFGVVWGTVLTWVGAMIGALLAFGIARKLGRPFVADVLTSGQLAKIDKNATVTGAPAMIAVRLVPVIAFNLINYGAGLTEVGWWRFTWTTAVGILPLTFLMALLGDQMREPTLTDWILLGGASLAMLAIVVLARRRGLGG